MASGTALARRLENQRRRMRTSAETAERRVVIAGGAAAIGFLEQRQTIPLSVLGIPTKLALGIGGTVLEANSSGATRRMAGALADAAFAIYGYQVAKTQQFIAGDDDESYVGDADYVGDEL